MNGLFKKGMVSLAAAGMLSSGLIAGNLADIDVKVSYTHSSGAQLDHAIIGSSDNGVNLIVTLLDADGEPTNVNEDGVTVTQLTVESDLADNAYGNADEDIKIYSSLFKRQVQSTGTERVYIDYGSLKGLYDKDTITIKVGDITKTVDVALGGLSAKGFLVRTGEKLDVDAAEDNNRKMNPSLAGGLESTNDNLSTAQGDDNDRKEAGSDTITVNVYAIDQYTHTDPDSGYSATSDVPNAKFAAGFNGDVEVYVILDGNSDGKWTYGSSSDSILTTLTVPVTNGYGSYVYTPSKGSENRQSQASNYMFVEKTNFDAYAIKGNCGSLKGQSGVYPFMANFDDNATVNGTRATNITAGTTKVAIPVYTGNGSDGNNSLKITCKDSIGNSVYCGDRLKVEISGDYNATKYRVGETGTFTSFEQYPTSSINYWRTASITDSGSSANKDVYIYFAKAQNADDNNTGTATITYEDTGSAAQVSLVSIPTRSVSEVTTEHDASTVYNEWDVNATVHYTSTDDLNGSAADTSTQYAKAMKAGANMRIYFHNLNSTIYNASGGTVTLAFKDTNGSKLKVAEKGSTSAVTSLTVPLQKVAGSSPADYFIDFRAMSGDQSGDKYYDLNSTVSLGGFIDLNGTAFFDGNTSYGTYASYPLDIAVGRDINSTGDLTGINSPWTANAGISFAVGTGNTAGDVAAIAVCDFAGGKTSSGQVGTWYGKQGMNVSGLGSSEFVVNNKLSSGTSYTLFNGASTDIQLFDIGGNIITSLAGVSSFNSLDFQSPNGKTSISTATDGSSVSVTLSANADTEESIMIYNQTGTASAKVTFANVAAQSVADAFTISEISSSEEANYAGSESLFKFTINGTNPASGATRSYEISIDSKPEDSTVKIFDYNDQSTDKLASGKVLGSYDFSNGGDFKEYVLYCDKPGEVLLTITDTTTGEKVAPTTYTFEFIDRNSGPSEKTIDLVSGWNLVSGPIADVTAISNISDSWAYDAGTWTENPSTVAEWTGAWVKVSDASSYTLGAKTSDYAEPTLNGTDWMLLGATEDVTVSTSAAVAWTYTDGAWTKDPTTVSQGAGYWVK